MPPNWTLVDKCGIWKVLGVIECDDCLSSVECWGEETILPESPEGQIHLAELFLDGTKKKEVHNDTTIR